MVDGAGRLIEDHYQVKTHPAPIMTIELVVS